MHLGWWSLHRHDQDVVRRLVAVWIVPQLRGLGPMLRSQRESSSCARHAAPRHAGTEPACPRPRRDREVRPFVPRAFLVDGQLHHADLRPPRGLHFDQQLLRCEFQQPVLRIGQVLRR